MSEISNPPAFPNMAPNSCGPHIDKRDGMTLRDWFAGQAIPALIPLAESDPTISVANVGAMIARMAYTIADAMLAERAKGGEV